MKNVLEILEKTYNNEFLRKKTVPLFRGNPGLGKTSIIKEFAKNKGVKCIDLIASQLMPHELSGIGVPDHSTKLMTYYDFDKLLNLEDGDILFFDELLNANVMVLNACLTILENRELISGKPLKDIMIVAAANKQGATPLTPQIKERFIWYDVVFDIKSWKNYMAKYFITDDMFEKFTHLILNETFLSEQYNFYTPRSVEKAINMVIAGTPNNPFKKVVDICYSLVTNTTGVDIEENGFVWKANEAIKWIKAYRIMNNIS